MASPERAVRLQERIVRSVVSASIALSIAAGGQAGAQPGATNGAALSSSARTSAVVDGAAGVELEVEFRYRARSRTVEVDYRLRNRGAIQSLAVFDRGDLLAVKAGRQLLGAIGQPGLVVQGADVEMLHAALPLPDPAPTSPPTPLAIRVSAGATLSGRFESQVWGEIAPRRLRWCVGVMPFDRRFFDMPAKKGAAKVYSAPFAAAQAQQVLCTPWYDVARGGFER